MFFEFLRFELRYWFRGVMLYIFLGIITLLMFAATVSDNVQVGGSLGNTYRNAPFVVQNFYVAASLLTILMTTAFVESSASRDFTTGSSALIFSKPIKKRRYLAGRFLGAVLVSMIPSLGVSLGILLAGNSSWAVPERWGAENWQAHLQGFLIFAVPNTLFIASVIFAIAVVTRSTLYCFVGTILLLVGYAVAAGMLSSLEREWIASLLDPLGGAAFSVATKYWTVDDKNNLCIPLTGYLLLNRVLWLSAAGAMFALSAQLFSFEERSRRSRRQKEADAVAPKFSINPVAVAAQSPGFGLRFAQLRNQIVTEWRSIVRSTVFIVILLAAILNMLPTVWFQGGRLYDLTTFPVTYAQIDAIRGSLYVFLVSIITYFSGVLVWKERDNRLHEIYGAMPVRNWTTYLAKFISLVGIVFVVLLLGITVSVCAQMASGYTRYQLTLYATEILLLDLLRMTFLIVLAFLAHTLAPNKYLGYFLFVICLVINAFAWQVLSIETLLVKYGRLPRYIYSDLYGFAPYAKGLLAFGLYWTLGATLLAIITVVLWQRGTLESLRSRLVHLPSRFRGATRLGTSLIAIAFVSLGGWIAYNTHVLNRTISSDQREKLIVEYEKKYQSLANKPQPRITKVGYTIDVYPETRNIRLVGEQTIENKSAGAIEEMFLTLDPDFKYDISIEQATLASNDERLRFQTYRFDPPLQSGEKRTMKYTVYTDTKGIENAVTNIQIVQNGTFFNSSITPQIGYVRDAELRDPKKRKDFGLPKTEGYPSLARECTDACMEQYVASASDWVEVETVISTSADQIAVAPGSLIESWEKEGRNYYRYRLDHPSLNFYSFISARYAVERAKQGDVDVEVYYHPEHKWNVPKMVKSIQASLDYCGKNFGPYAHKQARIIEFPRVATFAQAFPGTMPYSESIGFIANLENPDDIDMVYYVVAHEMAHQWWAHQVIGARMKGATLLSETLAQYSALMIMEKEYGRDMMRKFLRHEMDTYLRQRGTEVDKEQPLLTVEPNQGYVHYRKGSVALYYLKECIGEERLNAALKELIEKFAYKEPPYPNAYHLIDALKKHTPAELHYVFEDLFETITLYSNRTETATAKKLDSGKYQVTLSFACEKLRADDKGKESAIDFNEEMEVGAFKKPEKGKKYGATLYRKRIPVHSGKQEVTFEVDELPETVGIDPFCLLIDRMPEDNSKRVEVQ